MVGVDIGGTKVNAGRVCGENLLDSYLSKIPPDAEHNAQSVIDVVINTIAKVFTSEVEGIGVGIPSVADREKGIVYDVQNIKSWQEIHLKEILEAEFKVPVL